jgi:hypothetical protein
MNDGVALLLERMKTNPDEFIDGGKWAHIMNKHEDFLDVEDRQALTNGLNKLMQQHFTQEVMEELVDPQKTKTQIYREANAKAAAAQMKSLSLNAGAVSGTITLNTPIAGVTQTL